MTYDEAPLNALLLLGGESRRLGRNKAELVFHEGLTQAQWTHRLLQQVCPRVYLSLRAEQADSGLGGVPAVRDLNLGLGGPMVGIYSALRQEPSAAWLVVSCDLPRLTIGTLRNLIEQRDPQAPATAYQSSSDGLPEPLCAIYEPSALPLMEAQFAEKRTCPRHLLKNSATHLIELPLGAREDLDNLNTPEDFRRIAPVKAPEERTLHLQYFAILGAQRGCSEETIRSAAASPQDLYLELQRRHGFSLPPEHLRVAINAEFALWETPLQDGDEVVFLPPMSGG